jgi:hydroxymethylpyrimidine/phosphomethylpyrimidine kinase
VTPPRILIASGFEPSGAVGLLADVSAAKECRCEVEAVPTALTAQSARVFRVERVPARSLERQLDAALERGSFSAVKLGMVFDDAQLRTLERFLRRPQARRCVVDPVVRSSNGQRLSKVTLRTMLLWARPDVVLTPNALAARDAPPS